MGRMFDSIPTPEGVKGQPSDLVSMALGVITLSGDAANRSAHRLRRGPMTLHNGQRRFVTRWQRELDKHYSFSLVDKRAVQAGVLLTANAVTASSNMVEVQAFVLNDTFPYIGLRRITNTTHPIDAVPELIEGLEKSTVAVPLAGRPGSIQVKDFAKALSTIYI